MNILITAATWAEVKPLEKWLEAGDTSGKFRGHQIELSITGIGSLMTAYHLGKLLPAGRWNLVMNLGICGSFRESFPPGTPVLVREEILADLGAEDDEAFLDAFELGLLDRNHFPFQDGMLKCISFPGSKTLQSLPKVRSITVNKVHGKPASIDAVVHRYQPDVESMEGAAFFYCCLKETLPFLEIRAVSNRIEKRNRGVWQTDLAVRNLNETVIPVLNELLNSSTEPTVNS